jgi:glyoxylase-like metal-dependent hydrolase (beta-lactamase superfamily II)
MKRSTCLVTLTLLGVVLTAATYEARQSRASIYITEVADNLYMLGSDPAGQGMQTGGNTAVFVMADGVALVDTKLAGYGPDILAEVRTLTDKPVTTIINTHTHFDHTGSNTEFPDTVNFVAHDNTLAQMSRTTCGNVTNCDAFKGENAKYLPKTTYSDRRSLFSGQDQIDLYYFGRGHTNGDSFVVFRAARTMHTGDMFQRKGLPFIDVAGSNGSAVEFGLTLMKAVEGIPNVDTIITGHHTAPLMWDDFVNFSGFYNDVVDKAQQGIAGGRSVAEVADVYTKPDRYSEFQASPQGVRTLVQNIYNEQ